MTKHLAEDIRREQIQDAARAAFVESGYITTRMEDIAKRSGLSKGGVYFHFSSKRELFDLLVEQEFERSITFLRQVKESEGTVAEKLAQLGDYFPLYFSQHPDTARFFVVMCDVALREPNLRERLRRIHDSYVRALQDVLDAGIKAGEIRPIDTRAVGILLKSLMDGLECGMATGIDLEMKDFLPAALSTVLEGIAKR